MLRAQEAARGGEGLLAWRSAFGWAAPRALLAGALACATLWAASWWHDASQPEPSAELCTLGAEPVDLALALWATEVTFDAE